MKINIITPHINITGGVRTIFSLSNELSDIGHQVTVVHTSIWRDQFIFARNEWFGFRNILRDIKGWKEVQAFEGRAEWFPLRAKLECVPNMSSKFIPNGDVIIATAFETAEWVATYPARKGRKVYLILGYEVWHGKERVHATYRLPFIRIAVASWLKKVVEANSNNQKCYLNYNGVDHKLFYPDEELLRNRAQIRSKRVGLLYHPYKAKGYTDGLRAIQMAKLKHPDLHLVVMGYQEPRAGELPEDAECYHNPPQDMIRKTYSSCGIWLIPSWNEGACAVHREAMACGCALVTTDVGGKGEYYIPGRTALVSPVRQPELLAQNLISLLEDESMMRNFGEEGLKHIQKFTWEKSAERMLNIVKDGIRHE